MSVPFSSQNISASFEDTFENLDLKRFFDDCGFGVISFIPTRSYCTEETINTYRIMLCSFEGQMQLLLTYTVCSCLKEHVLCIVQVIF